MFVNDVFNKEELTNSVIAELKILGIKYRKEKKIKFPQEKCGRKRIFRVHLHQLDLTDVLLENGSIVQIPKFFHDACQRICDEIEVEGLFRKTGSHLRQKEIKTNLERGLSLDKNCHVIDVANVLKSFLRELPEPLLPLNLQEVLLRGFLLAEGKLRAMLLSCLLLPPLTLNTFTFFMQFLKKVSSYSDQNKMTISNLAIIFTPGLMPINSDINSIRFNNHVKIVQILIQNADSIGILPHELAIKFEEANVTPTKHSGLEQSLSITATNKKKKKRRSGSLNRMLNGIRKIVSAIGSSSENLDSSAPESTVINTPCITKSSKKRKMAEAVSGFSTKKKKDLLNLFPDGNILPNTPMFMKESKKKPRISLSARKQFKKPAVAQNADQSSISSTIERRWSVVGSAWTRKKNNSSEQISTKQNLKTLSPVISLPHIPQLDFAELAQQQNDTINMMQREAFKKSVRSLNDEYKTASDDSIDYVCVPKNEYEAIKERVESIEKRISIELGNDHKTLNATTDENSLVDDKTNNNSTSFETASEMTGPEKVINKFEKTIEETENIAISPTTDHLAKRLSRELKIRRNEDQRIIRSPSARKIGSMRRRSRDKIRVSRNATWHISSTRNSLQEIPVINSIDSQNNGLCFYPKNAITLKRGRPNTIQSGLHNPIISYDTAFGFEKNATIKNDVPQISTIDVGKDHLNSNVPQLVEKQIKSIDKNPNNWMDGAEFFNDDKLDTSVEKESPKSPDVNIFRTPCTESKLSKKKSITPTFATPAAKVNIEAKTPMLPPKSIPRKALKTPGSTIRLSAQKKFTDNPAQNNPRMSSMFSPLKNETATGRASIARLRALNAGMVLAKAKLFDDLDQSSLPKSVGIQSNLMANRRQSSHFSAIKNREDFEEKLTTKKNTSNISLLNKFPIQSIDKENSPNHRNTMLNRNSKLNQKSLPRKSKIVSTTHPMMKGHDKIVTSNCSTTIQKETTIISKNLPRHGNSIRRQSRSPRKNITPRIKNQLTGINSPRKYIHNHKTSKPHFTDTSAIQLTNRTTPLRATSFPVHSDF